MIKALLKRLSKPAVNLKRYLRIQTAKGMQKVISRQLLLNKMLKKLAKLSLNKVRKQTTKKVKKKKILNTHKKNKETKEFMHKIQLVKTVKTMSILQTQIILKIIISLQKKSKNLKMSNKKMKR